MDKKSTHFFGLVGVILGITLVVSLIVVLIGRVYDWDQPVQFSNGFFIAGAIVILLGTLSVAGGFQQRANFQMTYAESAGRASIPERAQRMMGDINQRYGMLVLLIGISVAIGTFLR
ncbi:MAG TPA: hypothetical protein VFY25_04895 [Anaerolineales bacterium]|nr:hypothetical protein [Anaerolineales bacterium]